MDLYLIATNPVSGYEAIARAAVECGLRYLQLRMKNAPRQAILETAHLYRKITQGTQTRFIVNDDLDIAMEVDADGIHLGQTDRSVAEARAIWNQPEKIFGLSTHSLEQALRAAKAEPDYIGIGPVHPTATKPDADPALGPQMTGQIAKASPLTSVAIGGITLRIFRNCWMPARKLLCRQRRLMPPPIRLLPSGTFSPSGKTIVFELEPHRPDN